MPKQRSKYRKGQPIRSLDELWAQDVVFFADKVVPRGWFQNWQLKMVTQQIFFGRICYAERRTDKCQNTK